MSRRRSRSKHVIDATTGAHGSASAPAVVDDCAQAVVTVTALAGYTPTVRRDGNVVALVSLGGGVYTYTIPSVQADHAIDVTFAAAGWTVTVTNSGPAWYGLTPGEGANAVADGATFTLTVVPNPGEGTGDPSQFPDPPQFSLDGASAVGPDSGDATHAVYSIVNVTADHTIDVQSL